mgnify:FL=1|jgi:PAS domain S-box/diguanylate cyclase (GGDEF) domain
MGRAIDLLDVIVDRINVGVLAVDRSFNLVLWNRFMELHSGRAAETVIGRNLFEAFPELPEKWLRKKIESVFILKNFAFTSWEQRPYLFRFRHNRPLTGGIDYMHQDCTFLPVTDDAGDVRYVCISVQDVTDTAIYQSMLKNALAQLEELSVRDALTGLHNRRHLETTLKAEFRRVRRYGGELSLVLFDIDHFKAVNDEYGHQAGDAVLKAVAERLCSVLRQSDVAGRYGGEEFMAILPNTELAGGMALAERLRQVIARDPVPWGDRAVSITVSIGVSALRADTASHEKLVSEADAALYRAKAEGRNRIAAFR